ncbi:heavy-metal-associated domain-containing protein [Candidatus Woesearchaeota archaeon]|jgi:copper chaperone|nr:heavy-metal-associated domain-containing protein [Candidatus Woesearchaeota archaeon]
MANIVLKVTGMKCGGCENQVREALMACNGVDKVTASHKSATVEVDYNPELTGLDIMRQAITAKGFSVEQ